MWAVDCPVRVIGHRCSVIIWGVVYVAFLALFVALGLTDPDTQRRAVVWPMAASFGGLAVLALARALFVGAPLGPGPWLACWLVVAALIASAVGRCAWHLELRSTRCSPRLHRRSSASLSEQGS